MSEPIKLLRRTIEDGLHGSSDKTSLCLLKHGWDLVEIRKTALIATETGQVTALATRMGISYTVNF